MKAVEINDSFTHCLGKLVTLARVIYSQITKVVYMSSSFWLLAPESRDLYQAEKKNNCLQN
jgi:hypothetical protein